MKTSIVFKLDELAEMTIADLRKIADQCEVIARNAEVDPNLVTLRFYVNAQGRPHTTKVSIP